MLIVSIREILTKSLIEVCVAVVLSAVIISQAFRAKNAETVAATANYAVVLVVFVGSSV